MTEMEMVRELRRVIAETVGQAGGNREKVKAKVREELVSVVKERFGRGTCPGRSNRGKEGQHGRQELAPGTVPSQGKVEQG